MTTTRQVTKSEATRRKIIDTALELFAEEGFEKTTMRGIAKRAELSLGAAYYYFSSKDELVLAFYQRTADEAREHNPEILAGSKDFKKRFRAIVEFKIEQLSQYRHLVKVLARQAADFSHPLSPLSAESKPMRDDAIQLVEQAIEGSNFKVNKSLRPYAAWLLWLYQLGLILFWANDRSKEQSSTRELLNISLSMIDKLFKLSALPVFVPVNRAIVKAVNAVVAGVGYEGVR